MKLNEIIKKIEYIKANKSIEDLDIDIDNVTNDSREVNEKSIFIAVKGFKKNGHDFIEDAMKKGVKVVLCEEENFLIREVAVFIIKNPRKILSKISSIIYGEPSKKLNLIGVTGTNGKTSITYILDFIFRYNDYKTGVIGTMGALINDKKYILNNTTPDSNQLHYYMKKMIDEDVKNCFMEVSSHSTMLNRVDDVFFNIGIFTNLTKDHLDFHNSMEEYYQAKKAFFYRVETAIINIDDEYGYRLYNELKNDNINVVSYSINKESDYKAKIKDTSINGTLFIVSIGKENHEFKINTPGKFSVYNTLASIIAAKLSEITIKNIQKSLNIFKGVIGRFEIIHSKLECTIILDFAHTPDGLEKIMETIDEVAVGRKIVMFGAGGERDISRRALMGEVAGRYCDLCYLTSDNPRYENPKSICEEIAKGVEVHHNNYKIIIDRKEAINHIIDNYKKNDIILLAGKSTEPYQAIEDKKVPYNERDITMKAIFKKEKSMEG
ncbi:MAG: UDP-N-acetylmuramoyl-L-alanyl-D-glutamate--2,6-diaminopimelate ligase [Bacillota bacterium]|nr:UDP-N-acetylmuramoyl-L-alanyl-D-glutamate--2,6-diaminopimelate ligase [Bacillota bacterium]